MARFAQCTLNVRQRTRGHSVERIPLARHIEIGSVVTGEKQVRVCE